MIVESPPVHVTLTKEVSMTKWLGGINQQNATPMSLLNSVKYFTVHSVCFAVQTTVSYNQANQFVMWSGNQPN